MASVNAFLRIVVDALLRPARDAPPLVSLTILSLVTAVAMLLVFKKTSNQPQLAAVKRRIHACLFEIRLFGDDLRAIIRAQVEILRHNATYLRLSLTPMLWVIVPLALVIAQLQFHYAYRGLKPGERTVVTVAIKDKTSKRPDVALQAPDGLSVETPAVWAPGRREISWRIRALRPGDYELAFRRSGGSSVSKSVRVTDRLLRLSPRRVSRSIVEELVYPAESPLPDGAGISAIEIDYPARKISVLGLSLHWMVLYFVLSIVFAFMLRKRFNVTI